MSTPYNPPYGLPSKSKIPAKPIQGPVNKPIFGPTTNPLDDLESLDYKNIV